MMSSLCLQSETFCIQRGDSTRWAGSICKEQLSVQVLIVFFCVRVYLDAEVMSLRGFWHQQKGETTNITSPNSSRRLCFFCPVSVSTWMLSSRLLGNESCATASEAASGVWISIRPTKNSRRGLGHAQQSCLMRWNNLHRIHLSHSAEL